VTAFGPEEGAPAIPAGTFDKSDFSAKITVNGRLCGVRLYADQQQTGRQRQASFGSEFVKTVVVVLADPGTTPSGDQLFPGDYLCKDEVGAYSGTLASGQLTAQLVSEVAGTLGQRLLDLQSTQNGGGGWLADPSGKVAVFGESAERVAPATISAIGAKFTAGVSPQQLPPQNSGDLKITGIATASTSVTVAGNLTVDNGVVYINGDLTVGGSILGTGAVVVSGSISAAGAGLSSDDVYGLVAGGSLDLPP
jgi:hypothetical protein